MPIHIYNSLTRKKEEFIPLQPLKVNIYTCGVTVYDECHIGHARSLYIFDVIRKYLEYRKFKVNFVRNITDIDDKIINKAKEEGKSSKEIAGKYITNYKKDLEMLGIPEADFEPKATENIPEMIKHIEGLIKKGIAYEVSGDVYFSVRQFKDYGKLSGQSIEQMLEAVRIEKDTKKKDPLDFALWKKSKEDEPFWESPWDKGRPGWHIECSVMSQKFLKTDTLDIHAGGRDLIFPHHENEIAQSQALTGKPFAKYWIHHGLLTINSQKMAKSLGNFITIKNFLDKYNNADILKLFFLSAHYSQPIDFTEEKIEACKKQKKNFDNFFGNVYAWKTYKQYRLKRLGQEDLGGKKKVSLSKEDKDKIDNICVKFEQAMDDDFNTSVALAALIELLDLALYFVSPCDKEEAFDYAKSKLVTFFGILGLTVKPEKEFPIEMLEKTFEREQDRKNKDFKKSDAKREEIKKKYKYLVSDTGNNITFTVIE